MTNLEASIILGGFNLRNNADKYDNEALDIAIDALEKQMPKTIIDVEDGILCPNCKSYVCTYGKVGRKNYCDNCGQALDWSVLDENISGL